MALSPMPWGISITFVKPSAPILVNLSVLLILFTTLLHLVPFLFQYEVQYLYVDYFGHTSLLLPLSVAVMSSSAPVVIK